MIEFAEEIREFLIESNENLNALVQQIVKLEKTPADEQLIAGVFRTIHSIKGTSGFFGFSVLGSITHIAESILEQVREKKRPLTPALVSLILETVDAVKQLLLAIEANNQEGEDCYQLLRERLNAAYLEGRETSALEPVPGEAVEKVYWTRADDRAASSTIRVDVMLLDRLMNLVDELVLARNQIMQGAQQSSMSSAVAQRLNLITSELQEGVMRARMQPIGVVWNIFPRVVRDLAIETGKKIEIKMEGTSTELDKNIIEAIKDPLMHIVRNACDHGIEPPDIRVAKGKSPHGTILLRAFHEGSHVHIEVSDDGAGIDPEKIKSKAVQKGLIQPGQAASMQDEAALRLILLPGLTTAEKVTSISGRGVGMDVVKTNIEKISGTVDIVNRNGMGITLKIKIPLTHPHP